MEQWIVNTPEYGDNHRHATLGSGPTRLGNPTLTAADWAEAGLQLVAESGLGALTVDALARRLGVTKGSFYWHFRGRSELLAATLDCWEQRTTTESIKGLNAVPDARRRLELMLDAASSRHGRARSTRPSPKPRRIPSFARC